jgi:nucleoside-diphosphate-sugar epimerase
LLKNNPLNKTILVTGGSGFLGSALSRRLIKLGHKVTIFDNNSRGSLEKISDIIDKIEFIEGDIRNINQVLEAAQGAQIIFHLSFVNGTKYFYEKPELVLEVGLKGALNTLEVAKKLSCETYIMASSSEVYNQPSNIPTNELERAIIPDIHNPRFSYAGGKLISELLTVNYLRKTNIRNLIFRPHNVFGPNMGFEHFLPEIIKKIFIASDCFKNDECKIRIQGTGLETRAFCYIDNAVDQLIHIMDNGIKGELYNIGMETEKSINDVIKDISKILNIEINILNSDILEGSTSRRCPDISKIKSIGYKKMDSYLDGLTATVEWYKNHYLNNNV